MTENRPKKERSPARRRTLRHMRNLLAKTATGAALGAAGCIVCDPLPPPVDCGALAAGDMARWLSGDASWSGATAQAGIRVQLSFLGPDATFVGAPTADAGTVQDVVEDAGGLAFTCVPAAGATTAHVAVMVQCETGTATVGFALDLTGTPTAGATVPLTFDP